MGRMRIPGRGRAAAVPVALVWFYEGFWCKVRPGHADQRAIVAGVPLLPHGAVTAVLVALGLAETLLGVWVLSGWRGRTAAVVQTVLLVVFNGGGLVFGGSEIAEPGRMLTQNFAFLALGWMVALRGAPVASAVVAAPATRGAAS
jgi:hypothetical protein